MIRASNGNLELVRGKVVVSILAYKNKFACEFMIVTVTFE